jgi:hypothetical protein
MLVKRENSLNQPLNPESPTDLPSQSKDGMFKPSMYLPKPQYGFNLIPKLGVDPRELQLINFEEGMLQ